MNSVTNGRWSQVDAVYALTPGRLLQNRSNGAYYRVVKLNGNKVILDPGTCFLVGDKKEFIPSLTMGFQVRSVASVLRYKRPVDA